MTNNLAEGYGRFHYKDSLKFYYNARGSLFEEDYWLNRLKKRDLAPLDLYSKLQALNDTEKIKLNNFINTIKAKV